MKKENYGIPAALLSVAIYLMGLYAAVNTSIWPLVAITVAVFALSFNSEMKKTAVQALGLALIICAVSVVLHILGNCNDMIKSLGDTDESLFSDYIFSGSYPTHESNGFDKFLNIMNWIVTIAAYGLYGVLAVCAAMGKGIFVGKVHMAVDGFIPVRPMPQQMYAGGQPYNPNAGQPQQFAGQHNVYPNGGMHQQGQGQQPMQNAQNPQMFAQRPQQTYNVPQQPANQVQNKDEVK